MNRSDLLPPVILMDCEIRAIEGVISTFGKKGIQIIVLTSQKDSPPPAFKSKYVNHTYFSPEVWNDRAYLDFLIELPHRGVLVYSSDAGAEFVSRYKTEIQQAGYLINISDFATFKRAFDKDRIYLECLACGVPTMKTKEVHKIEDIYTAVEEIGFPLFLKPTRLAGGHHYVIKTTEDIPPAFEEMNALIQSEKYAAQKSKLIVQETITYGYDDIYCCESYYPVKGLGRDFLSIQKLRPNINYDGSVGSRVHVGKTIKSPELEKYTQLILDHLDWKGFAHLDWLYSKKHQSFLLCEINPRLPGFSNFITSIGFDMAWNYYADLTKEAAIPFRFKNALYFEALRHPGDLTTNLLAVFKGHLSFWSFLKPYLNILTLRYKVVFDVFYGSDLKLTWENYKISIHNLIKKFNKT